MTNIFDKRPGKGRFVSLEEWCANNKFSLKTAKKWSLLYKFPILKLGDDLVAYESDLNNAVQRTIEAEEQKIERRRQRSRAIADEKKKAYNKFMGNLMGETFNEQRNKNLEE